jgi:hypothetical protein
VDGLSLPQFRLRPENVGSKLANLFGAQDVDFEEYPDFSGKYAISADDEEAVRACFSPHLIQFLELNELDGVIEAAGNTMIFYRPGRRVPPGEMLAFFEEARTVVGAFG